MRHLAVPKGVCTLPVLTASLRLTVYWLKHFACPASRLPRSAAVRFHRNRARSPRCSVTHGATCIAALIAVAAHPRVAWAHVGRAPEPHDLWSAWTFAPAVVAVLALSAWLYARGVREIWSTAGRGRVVARWRAACFAGGTFAVALALLSPIDALGSALFSVHMTQHMLLIVVAAPLLMLGDPPTAMLW